jgi:hypothetical protein
MKIAARLLLIVLLGGTVALLSNCKGKDPAPASKEKTQLGKLVTTWNLTTVTLDGTPRADFTNVTLALSGNFVADGGTYTYSFPTGTFPNPSPWRKTGGEWKFGPNPEAQIVRVEDDQVMNYSLSSNNTVLTIAFTYAGAGFVGGRVNEVKGNWSFEFTKQ